jgi:hypothetical protein
MGYGTAPGTAQDPYAAQQPYGQPGTQAYGQPSGQAGYPQSTYPSTTSPYGTPQPGYPSTQQPPGQTGTQAYGQPGAQPYGQPGYTAPGYPQTSNPGQGYGTPSYGGYPGSGYPAAPGYPTYRSPDSPSATAPPAALPPGASPPPASAPGAAPATPIGLEVALLRQEIKEGQKVPVIMEDGDVVKDGRGDPQAGDKFKIVFRPDADGYVYVISIDGSGWAQGLFPSQNSSAGNPVSKDQIYVLPEGNNWYSLDQYRGIETIYLVASFQRRPDIEESVKIIAGRERPASAVPQQVTEPAVIPQGFGTSAPGKETTIKSDSGQGSQVKLTAFYSRQPNEDLRLTRWFKHE